MKAYGPEKPLPEDTDRRQRQIDSLIEYINGYIKKTKGKKVEVDLNIRSDIDKSLFPEIIRIYSNAGWDHVTVNNHKQLTLVKFGEL